ncbi:hypothetical protein CAter282_3757 [Collimonas arenae]|uniref:Uncharacterized protein n=1 Tax=Collimonas arenae TaxID=279058 RepID=A0A127QNN5_9BURK|nr:hypothetical protein CAter282_3757 [Collimonas arenae]
MQGMAFVDARAKENNNIFMKIRRFTYVDFKGSRKGHL